MIFICFFGPIIVNVCKAEIWCIWPINTFLFLTLALYLNQTSPFTHSVPVVQKNDLSVLHFMIMPTGLKVSPMMSL